MIIVKVSEFLRFYAAQVASRSHTVGHLGGSLGNSFNDTYLYGKPLSC